MSNERINISLMINHQFGIYTPTLKDIQGNPIQLIDIDITDVYFSRTDDGIKFFNTAEEADSFEGGEIEHFLRYQLSFMKDDFVVNCVESPKNFTNYKLLNNQLITFSGLQITSSEYAWESRSVEKLISEVIYGDYKIKHVIRDLVIDNDSPYSVHIRSIKEKFDVENATLLTFPCGDSDISKYNEEIYYNKLAVYQPSTSGFISCSEELVRFDQVEICGRFDNLQSLKNAWCNTKIISVDKYTSSHVSDLLKTDYVFENAEIVRLDKNSYNLEKLFPNAKIYLCGTKVPEREYKGTGIIRELSCLRDIEKLNNDFDIIEIPRIRLSDEFRSVNKYSNLTLTLTKANGGKSARNVV